MPVGADMIVRGQGREGAEQIAQAEGTETVTAAANV